MRAFKDSAFIAAARIEIGGQINDVASDLNGLAKLAEDTDESKLEGHDQDLFEQVVAGVHQIKSLFEGANQMVRNIENFLLSKDFPSSEEMKESIKNSGADITALDELDEYKALSKDEKEKFTFVVANYELISTMLDSANELCAVLHKAVKRL